MFLRLIIFLVSFQAVAQSQFRFEHFTIKNGLPQNTVHCTFKDSEGFYWFGTQDGLCRFDGYSVKNFRHSKNDSTTLSDNFILDIAEDKFRNLWIGTRNGMNKLDRRTEEFSRIIINEKEKKEFHNNIWFINSNADGDILFTNTFNQLVKISSEKNSAQILHNDAVPGVISGEIYIRNAKDTLIFYSAKDEKEINRNFFPDSIFGSINSICKINSEKLAVGTKRGLFFIEKNKSPQVVYSELKNIGINVMFNDSKNNLWIGTAEGVCFAENNKNSVIAIKHISEDSESLASNNVQSIYEDSDGLIWIGTSEGGVNIYDPKKTVFKIFHQNTSVSLPSNSVFGIFQNKNELWIGTNSGLAHFTLESENISGIYSNENKILKKEIFTGSGKNSDSICSNIITAIIQDNFGNMWFGSQNNGISIYSPQTKKWEHLNEKNTGKTINNVFHILCASDEKIWISTMNGLYYCSHPSKKIAKISDGYIFSIFEDTNKTIWAATTSGAYHFSATGNFIESFESEPDNPKSLSYNMSTSFFRDSKGNFWVATLGGGLNLLDEKNKTFTDFTTKEGLLNDVIYCILQDISGKLWLSTNEGISCFDTEKKMFTNYSEKDGIVSKEFVQNSAFINENGELLFGSPEGLLVFQPEKIDFSEKEIPVVLTSLKINYEENNYFPGDEIQLFYNDKTVSFEFSALDFSHRHKISFSYKLEGFDNNWNTTSAYNRIASYTNLPFGNYVFKVRAKTGNNEWHPKQLAIKLNAIPPFWLSKWFIAVEIVFIFLIVVSLVKYYAQRKLKKKLREAELQKKIFMERERISRDLHDNVGSHLTYITSTLDNISYKIEKEEKEEKEKLNEKISSLSDFSRETMQQLRETIWAMNKETVQLSELKNKVDEHISKISAESDLNFSVNIKSEKNPYIKPANAIHLFRIVQEAVNNSIKHSRAKNISIEIGTTTQNAITIKISDDGNGFDLNQNTNGHYGLENMKARAKEISGKLTIYTENGKGTVVEIVL